MQNISRLRAEEPRKNSEDRKEDDVCFSSDLTKKIGMLRYQDTYDKEEGGIVPPFTHEPVFAGKITAVAEPEASAHHGQNKDGHEDRRDRSVLDQAVKNIENEVEDRDLNDVPHVGVDQRPSGKHIEDLLAFDLRATGTDTHRKDEDTHIERYEDRDEAFLQERLQVVFLILQACIKAIAREEKEDTDKEDAAFGKEFQRT